MKSEILDYGGYLIDFHLNETNLKGKTILDLGAGARSFAFDSLVNNVGLVISLDKDTANWRQLRRWTQKQLARDANNEAALIWQQLDQLSLGGQANHLPFPNNQFDLILSRSVVPQMLTSKEAKQAFKEILRVLKPGGQALFYPFVMEHWSEEEIATSKQILETLNQQENLTLNLEPISFRETSRPGTMLQITKLG